MKMQITMADIANKFECQIDDIEIIAKKYRKLAEAHRGEVVTISGIDFIVFEHRKDNTTELVTKDFIAKSVQFDSEYNNYAYSDIRKYLNNDFYNELGDKIGKQNIPEHTVNLITLDGRADYGTCKDYISLPTFDFVRRNIDVFDKYKNCIDDWQWLATAWSTEATDCKKGVCCLLPLGDLNYDYCYGNDGVRAFCTLNSSILISD